MYLAEDFFITKICHPELVSGSYNRLNSDGILKQVQDDSSVLNLPASTCCKIYFGGIILA